MSNDVYVTVCDCLPRKQNFMHGKKQRYLKLFLLGKYLKHGGIDILGTLPKDNQGHRFLVVMTD